MAKYATQMDAAKQGILTPEMETVAKEEHLAPELIRERVAKGTICIPANINHKSLHPYGIGEGLRTKMNVNLGISGDCHDYTAEFEKVKLAIQFQCEAIMDLSNYGKTHTFRKQLIEMSPAMIGTVPMYDAIGYLEKDLADIKATDFLKVLEAHAKEGVDFQTIHAGINRRAVEALKRQKRTTNIVSRGGSLLFAWMEMTGNENPFYEYYDDVLDILRKYDVTISLGDALRPGCNADSTDAGQISELVELGALTKRAWERDVQVMVEGPGHMTMDEIAANMKLQKRLCYGAPFYVLGPLVTDVAPGYDHSCHRRCDRRNERCGLPVLCYSGGTSAPAGSPGCPGWYCGIQDRRSCRRPGTWHPRRKRLGQCHEQGSLRNRLGGNVCPGDRPGKGTELFREPSAAGSPHLLHVRQNVRNAYFQ